MKWAVRIALLLALLTQAGAAWVATRYSLAYSDGVVASREYRQAEAWQAFDRARDQRSTHCEVWTWAGDSALALGEAAYRANDTAVTDEALSRAWTDYTGAVLRCPRDSWSWSGLAAVALLQSKSRDRGQTLDLDLVWGRTTGVLDTDRAIAATAAEIAVSLNPGGHVELDVLAEIHEANGDLDAARDAFVESARRMPAPSFHSWGDGRKLSQPLYEAVLEGLESGLIAAPQGERSMLHFQIGKFASAQGDPASAVRHLESALEFASNPYRTFQSSWEISIVRQNLGRLEAARDALLLAKETGYASDLVSRRLGQISMSLEDFDRACRELRRALRAAPTDTGLRLQASGACEASGDQLLAERLLRRGFVLPEQNMLVARALLDYYRRNDRNYTAATLARRWAEKSAEPEFQAWKAEFDAGGI